MKIPGSAIGLLFPGQGSHNPTMLDHIQNHAMFHHYGEPVLAELGVTSITKLFTNPENINLNKTSSLITVLVNALMLDIWRTNEDSQSLLSLAGYSVGQWSAIYAAGGVNYPQLIRIVAKRAEIMDQCVKKTPSAMMAVIGLSEEVVEQFCASIRNQGHFITISNYNCIEQYSLAGTIAAINFALDKINELSPKKVVPLQVSGGWHCQILNEAAENFLEYLETEELHPLSIPVIDNVTGDYLPCDSAALRNTLAEHISHPVRWQQGIELMIDNGCRELIEIGYGQMLTLFGLFINGRLRNRSYHQELYSSH